MIYKLNKRIFDGILPAQREELLETFSNYNAKGNAIELVYEDHNYQCLPFLENVLSSNIHALSFFSGCGGLDIGTQMAGVKIITSLDFDKDAIATLRSNKFFAHTEHRCDDIRNVTAKDYSSILKKNNPEKLILVGGPPCQPFSKGAYWITNEKRKGVEDERNMIGEYLRIIEEIRPDGFLLENVESILHPTNKVIVEHIESKITQMGYNFLRVLANATEYGVPQRRKRVIFLASRNKIVGEPSKLSAEDASKVNVLNWIGRFDTSEYAEPNWESTSGKTYDQELKAVPPGQNYIALSARKGYPNPRFVANKRFWNFLLKLHPLLPSWTISAQPGPWVGPFHWNNRRLRSVEVAAIQTFPVDYDIVGSRRDVQRQIGNAVPSLMAQRFVEHLVKFL